MLHHSLGFINFLNILFYYFVIFFNFIKIAYGGSHPELAVELGVKSKVKQAGRQLVKRYYVVLL